MYREQVSDRGWCPADGPGPSAGRSPGFYTSALAVREPVATGSASLPQLPPPPQPPSAAEHSKLLQMLTSESAPLPPPPAGAAVGAGLPPPPPHHPPHPQQPGDCPCPAQHSSLTWFWVQTNVNAIFVFV